MNRSRGRHWLLSLLVLVALLLQPVGVAAQCMFASTLTDDFGMTFTVFKVFTMATVCTRTVDMAASCNPTGPVVTTGLFASAMTATTATMSVSCAWNCACGQVIIDGSDGLPVELMDFEIEGGEDAAQDGS